jgi:hypothetical protein
MGRPAHIASAAFSIHPIASMRGRLMADLDKRFTVMASPAKQLALG